MTLKYKINFLQFTDIYPGIIFRIFYIFIYILLRRHPDREPLIKGCFMIFLSHDYKMASLFFYLFFINILQVTTINIHSININLTDI